MASRSWVAWTASAGFRSRKAPAIVSYTTAYWSRLFCDGSSTQPRGRGRAAVWAPRYTPNATLADEIGRQPELVGVHAGRGGEIDRSFAHLVLDDLERREVRAQQVGSPEGPRVEQHGDRSQVPRRRLSQEQILGQGIARARE